MDHHLHNGTKEDCIDNAPGDGWVGWGYSGHHTTFVCHAMDMDDRGLGQVASCFGVGGTCATQSGS